MAQAENSQYSCPEVLNQALSCLPAGFHRATLAKNLSPFIPGPDILASVQAVHARILDNEYQSRLGEVPDLSCLTSLNQSPELFDNLNILTTIGSQGLSWTLAALNECLNDRYFTQIELLTIIKDAAQREIRAIENQLPHQEPLTGVDETIDSAQRQKIITIIDFFIERCLPIPLTVGLCPITQSSAN